eukprot:symbB.v1.2.033280.t1/scaffold4110.1/size46135/5
MASRGCVRSVFAFWLPVALLQAFLFQRSSASFAKGSGPSVVASGSFSPADLSEPNELDLLDDDREMGASPQMPMLPQEQDLPGDSKEHVRDKEFLFTGEHAWACASFIVGYAIVQYVLTYTRDLHDKEE